MSAILDPREFLKSELSDGGRDRDKDREREKDKDKGEKVRLSSLGSLRLDWTDKIVVVPARFEDQVDGLDKRVSFWMQRTIESLGPYINSAEFLVERRVRLQEITSIVSKAQPKLLEEWPI